MGKISLENHIKTLESQIKDQQDKAANDWIKRILEAELSASIQTKLDSNIWVQLAKDEVKAAKDKTKHRRP